MARILGRTLGRSANGSNAEAPPVDHPEEFAAHKAINSSPPPRSELAETTEMALPAVPPPGVPPAALEPGPGYGEDGPRLTVSSAVRNNWASFLLPIVILVAIAVAAGLLRSPTYSAETRLAVGGLDASSPASNSDFAAAAASLAQTYGRSIQGDAVVADVARSTGASAASVRSHISAFTVPTTPLFTVQATASSPGTAIALANLASQALIRAADSATDDIVSPLLQRYRQAEIAEQQLAGRVDDLESAGLEEDLIGAQSDLAIARTRTASAREAFITGSQRQQALAVPIQVIERANTAVSDRTSVLQFWVFVAIVLGLILGTALALFRESRFQRYMTA